MKFQILIPLVVSLSFFAACSEEGNIYESMSPKQIYDDAQRQVNEALYDDAAATFEEIERLHPYSDWARRGTINAAYYYGRINDYEKSRSAANRFLASYPGDRNAAYAKYLVAMSYYDQLDDRGRDQENTMEALKELQAVTAEYPGSDYARSAELKFQLAANHMASNEMEIGRFYLKRGNYTAAINRFQYVIREYETTAHVPEALHRLVEAYLSLGLLDEAREAAVILGYNFQSSEWYEDSHALFIERDLDLPTSTTPSDSLLRQVFRQTIGGEWI